MGLAMRLGIMALLHSLFLRLLSAFCFHKGQNPIWAGYLLYNKVVVGSTRVLELVEVLTYQGWVGSSCFAFRDKKNARSSNFDKLAKKKFTLVGSFRSGKRTIPIPWQLYTRKVIIACDNAK
ncbi:hypothetical protein M9H77_13295 [Catharanthus roseus]|uniref:Uncharacterized protein n=1 Tax=Catharanthus roseus TaxID=4058 RepID=A0ACC0BJS6_CATRO|nr:hypothetical protein M9H77_13295 [Catharanthus roseus]